MTSGIKVAVGTEVEDAVDEPVTPVVTLDEDTIAGPVFDEDAAVVDDGLGTFTGLAVGTDVVVSDQVQYWEFNLQACFVS